MHKTSTLTSPPDAGTSKVFDRSFDFSEFPNLQEVEFGVCWAHGGLPWIPIALSTLRPTTSPRLSAIRLDFTHSFPSTRYVDDSIEATGDDLRRVADEVTRIEREFGGAVNPAVLLGPSFKAALDMLNVRFLWQVKVTSCSYPTLADPSTLRPLGWELRAPLDYYSPRDFLTTNAMTLDARIVEQLCPGS